MDSPKMNPSLARAPNKDDNVPLHEAAKTGSRDAVTILLQQKQSLKSFCNKIEFEYFVYDFVKSGLFVRPVHHYNRFGESALVIASQYDHMQIVELLLTASSSQYEVTPYEWDRSVKEAAYRGYKDVFVAMLDKQFSRDSNTNILDRLNVYYIAHRLFAAPLWQVPESHILHKAVQGGHLEIIVAMLEHRYWRSDFMTCKDEDGRCAIHVAAMKGRWDIVNEFMLRMPDSIAIRSSDHKSVLHFAVQYNQIHIVQNILANKEADKAEEMVSRDHDNSANTTLHLAAINEVSFQLLDDLLPFRGDNINFLNNEGMTALDIAEDNPNCADIVERLKAAGAIRSSLLTKSNTASVHRGNGSERGIDKDTINTHMVVASLIATVTFAAILTIPGGIEDDKESIHYGAAKLALHKVFKLFLASDTLAFLASLTVVVGWLLRQELQDSRSGSLVIDVMSNFCEASLLVSIISTVVSFVTATILVIIPHNLGILKSKDKMAFRKYDRLWQTEVVLTILTPLFIAMMLRLASVQRVKKMRANFILLCNVLSYLMLIVLISGS